jgi:hypothetical protein
MTRYEYHHESFFFSTDCGLFSAESLSGEVLDEWTARCDELGRKGWRLIAALPIDPHGSTSGAFAVYTFIRPLPEDGQG